MKLRFAVDQAESFRRGINAPDSIATIEVDRAKLDPVVREKIAVRLRGVEVCRRVHVMRSTGKILHQNNPMAERAEEAPTGEYMLASLRSEDPDLYLIQAKVPTLDGLLEAIRENDKELGIEEDITSSSSTSR